MSRWSLQYEDPKDARPPSGWGIWRIGSWTMLFSALGFLIWALNR